MFMIDASYASICPIKPEREQVDFAVWLGASLAEASKISAKIYLHKNKNKKRIVIRKEHMLLKKYRVPDPYRDYARQATAEDIHCPHTTHASYNGLSASARFEMMRGGQRRRRVVLYI